MKKLSGSSFGWISWRRSPAINSQGPATPNPGGLIKLCYLNTALLLGIMLLGFSAPVVGQAVNATLLGTVTDSSSAVVAGAKVTITEMNTGVKREAATNDSGNYEFPNLPPGRYEVAVNQQGFKRAVRSNVDVLVNADVRVNLELQPGTASETIPTLTYTSTPVAMALQMVPMSRSPNLKPTPSRMNL